MKKEQIISQDENNLKVHRRVASDGQSDLLEYKPTTSLQAEDYQANSPHIDEGNTNAVANELQGKEIGLNNKEAMETHALTGIANYRSTSPKLTSLEDEERFMRDLGWDPEDPVPELTEEEIESIKLVPQIHIQKKQFSLDDGMIKKWQNERQRLSLLAELDRDSILAT